MNPTHHTPGQNRANPQRDRKTAKQRRTVENDEYAGFLRRVITAHGRRVATGDVEGLADLIRLSTTVETAIDTAVSGLRGCGYSWTEIATRLGISRQAAHQRWGGDN